jgi:flagellar protein FliO/FliZ
MSYTPDLISTAVKMLFALLVVLGAMFILFHFMKKMLQKNVNGTKQKGIRVLANTYIGMKKNITMIEIPGSVLVLGVTNENITLLSRIDDVGLVQNIVNSDGDRTPSSFVEHFKSFVNKPERTAGKT